MTIKTMAVARAAGVIGATVALVVGVTFAVTAPGISTSASLTNNTIDSATANLLVWNGSDFTQTADGFHVTGLVPGEGSASLPFYFKNSGDVDLTVTAHVPNLPATTGFTGFENLTAHITNNFTGTSIDTNMALLNAGDVALPGNPLHAGAQGNSGVLNTEGNYTISFDIAPGSVNAGASSVTVGNFDLVFTGTQPATP